MQLMSKKRMNYIEADSCETRLKKGIYAIIYADQQGRLWLFNLGNVPIYTLNRTTTSHLWNNK